MGLRYTSLRHSTKWRCEPVASPVSPTSAMGSPIRTVWPEDAVTLLQCVGEASGFVPMYLTKLFPAAADAYPAMHETKLIIDMVPGKGLVVKDIGY